MKANKFLRFMFGLPLLGIFLLVSCLDSVPFDPDSSLNININGELSIFDANNAVLWVINRTGSVDVKEVSIDAEGESLEGYPRVYKDMPAPGHSFATYHRPGKGKEVSPSDPYKYVVKMKVDDQGKTVELSKDKYLPVPSKEYALFLVRLQDGTLELVDDDNFHPDLYDQDDVASPLPPGPNNTNATWYPIILRNRTVSAKVDSIEFGPRAFGIEVAPTDTSGYYLPADQYTTVVNYTVFGGIGGMDSGSTTPHNVQIIRETTTSSQSHHLLFLDFYHATDGKYKLTQNWELNKPNDLDQEENYHGDVGLAKVHVFNDSAKYDVYAVGAKREGPNRGTFAGPEYVIDYHDFSPTGFISRGFNKVASFKQKPDSMHDFTIPYGSTYMINIYMAERTTGLGGRGSYVVVPFRGQEIFPGKTIYIHVDDLDVDAAEEAQDEVRATVFEELNDWDAESKTGDKPTETDPTDVIDVSFEDDPGNEDGLFEPVTDITGIPGVGTAGKNMSLKGTVVPTTATNKTIVWSIVSGTGANISGTTLSVTSSVVVNVTVRATITNGKALTGTNKDFTKDFTIQFNPAATGTPEPSGHVPVTDVIGIPGAGIGGTEVDLDGIVVPSDASKQTIIWSVVGSGGTITGNKLRITATGTITLKIKATIIGGGVDEADYEKEFSINVTPDPGGNGNDDFFIDDGTNDGKNGHGKARITGIRRYGWVDHNGKLIGRENPPVGEPKPSNAVKFVYKIYVKVEITGVITIGNQPRKYRDTDGKLKDIEEHSERQRDSRRHRDIFVVGDKTPKPDDPKADEDGLVDTSEITKIEDIAPNCAAGQIGIPVTSVKLKGVVGQNAKGNAYNIYLKQDDKWWWYDIEILPANASHTDLLWSKGILVYPDSVEIDTTSQPGRIGVKMSSQYREKKDQLPREANKLDLMVWADNCTMGLTNVISRAPQNFSREEGVLFVSGRGHSGFANGAASGTPNGIPGYPTPLYQNPPSLDQWQASFKNNYDKRWDHAIIGRPYSQPKVKIMIEH